MSPGERDSREDMTGQLTSEGSEIGWLLLHEVKREWRGEKDFYFRRWQFRAWWLMCEFNFRRVFSFFFFKVREATLEKNERGEHSVAVNLGRDGRGARR